MRKNRNQKNGAGGKTRIGAVAGTARHPAFFLNARQNLCG
jgi:hypothetical protein